jgi:hypothetical protein
VEQATTLIKYIKNTMYFITVTTTAINTCINLFDFGLREGPGWLNELGSWIT